MQIEDSEYTFLCNVVYTLKAGTESRTVATLRLPLSRALPRTLAFFANTVRIQEQAAFTLLEITRG